jgi:hypothetical protein
MVVVADAEPLVQLDSGDNRHLGSLPTRVDAGSDGGTDPLPLLSSQCRRLRPAVLYSTVGLDVERDDDGVMNALQMHLGDEWIERDGIAD